MGDSYPGNYYNSQLTHSPAPNFQHDFFSIEKILKKKTEKKKSFYLVKFLFYPAKFNQWIPEENLKTSNEVFIH
jgi:hypothetical protein